MKSSPPETLDTCSLNLKVAFRGCDIDSC